MILLFHLFRIDFSFGRHYNIASETSNIEFSLSLSIYDEIVDPDCYDESNNMWKNLRGSGGDWQNHNAMTSFEDGEPPQLVGGVAWHLVNAAPALIQVPRCLLQAMVEVFTNEQHAGRRHSCGQD